jgi:hypothetical protein
VTEAADIESDAVAILLVEEHSAILEAIGAQRETIAEGEAAGEER